MGDSNFRPPDWYKYMLHLVRRYFCNLKLSGCIQLNCEGHTCGSVYLTVHWMLKISFYQQSVILCICHITFFDFAKKIFIIWNLLETNCKQLQSKSYQTCSKIRTLLTKLHSVSEKMCHLYFLQDLSNCFYNFIIFASKHRCHTGKVCLHIA